MSHSSRYGILLGACDTRAIRSRLGAACEHGAGWHPRHDGEMCAGKVIEFVSHVPECGTLGEQEILARLEAKGLRPVTKTDLELLAHAEAREAQTRQLNSFKFADNDAMSKAIAEERERMRASRIEKQFLERVA